MKTIKWFLSFVLFFLITCSDPKPNLTGNWVNKDLIGGGIITTTYSFIKDQYVEEMSDSILGTSISKGTWELKKDSIIFYCVMLTHTSATGQQDSYKKRENISFPFMIDQGRLSLYMETNGGGGRWLYYDKK